jgi:hypothetical protein
MKEKPDERVLDISLDKLEEDCQRQPQLLFIWGTKLAQVKKDAKVAKNNLKMTAAKLDKEIRADPDSKGLEKITEKAVELCILDQPEYQDAQAILLEAEYEEDVLQAFVSALYDKSGELEKLIKLHGQMYWSKPDTSGSPKSNDAARTAQMQATAKTVGKKK